MDISAKIELRKSILIFLYECWDSGEIMVDTEKIVNKFSNVSEIDLDRQILYLEDKYYLEAKGKYNKLHLGYYALKITASGIDLVENKEEFNHLFKIEVNNISELNNSVVTIGNNNSVNNSVNQIDKVIELIEKMNHPKKSELLKIAQEYKNSSSPKKLQLLLSVTADIVGVAPVLYWIIQSLSQVN